MSFNKSFSRKVKIQLTALSVVAIVALASWIAVLIWGNPIRGWGAMLQNFLFFTCLSAGMIVWPAILFAADGRWQKNLIRPAAAGLAFMPACLLLFILLVFGSSWWAPWRSMSDLPNRAWLNAPFLFLRDFAVLVLFWALAFYFVWKCFSRDCRRLSAWLTFIFCAAFTLLGFDLVMALKPHWTSSLFGGYFFISSLYIALAGWTVILLTQFPDAFRTAQRNDFALLMVAFGLLTSYLMYAQLLVIWYENMPRETTFLLPRINPISQWRYISIVLLFSFYMGPLFIFLIPWFRHKRTWLWAAAVCLLISMWLERWWLIMPALDQPLRFGFSEVTSTVFVASVFLLSFLLAQSLWPHRFVCTEPPES